jgi:hypothetical protein
MFDKAYNKGLIDFFEKKERWWEAEARRLKAAILKERTEHRAGWETRVRLLSKQEKKAETKVADYQHKVVQQDRYLRYLETVYQETEEHERWLAQNNILD